MRKMMGLVAGLMLVLVAATPAAPPVITVDGLAAAAKLSPAAKAAVAPHVKALNASLEKFVAYHTANPDATHEQMSADLKPLHEELMKQHDALMQLIDPSQHEACLKYMHEKLMESGMGAMLGEHLKHLRDRMHEHKSGGHGA